MSLLLKEMAAVHCNNDNNNNNNNNNNNIRVVDRMRNLKYQ